MNRDIKIVIIDYGVGNVQSVYNSISILGYRKVKVSSVEEDLKNADALILPGVGAFDKAMLNLQKKKLVTILNKEVIDNKKPILGICLGMQLLSEGSEENGWHEGLGWIKGKIVKLDLAPSFSVPHVGWNEVIIQNPCLLFDSIQAKPHFYFDHSYHFIGDGTAIAAYCDYGSGITAAIRKNNIYGVQFHPEKSQANGLRLFRRFFNSVTLC